jgi:hypothetical protein
MMQDLRPMIMTSRILVSATLLTAFCGVLPAVDPQLLSLAMPDAAAMADVNVLTAKASPFGQYVIGQMIGGSNGFTTVTTVVGFDPRQDLNEILLCSNGTPETGLALATGTFNVSAISAAAALGGVTTETYHGVTILEGPKQLHGVAFLGSAIAVAGDVADVKAAIDRQGKAAELPPAVIAQMNQLSATEDAWFLTTVPPATLQKHAGTVAGVPANAAQNILQQVQAASGGVKFGSNVQLNVQAQADNAQDAAGMAGVLQLLVNLAQANSAKNPQGAAALQNLTVSASGTAVNIALTLPEDQFQQLFAKPAAAKKAALRKQ